MMRAISGSHSAFLVIIDMIRSCPRMDNRFDFGSGGNFDNLIDKQFVTFTLWDILGTLAFVE